MRNIRNGDYMLRKLENEIVKECAPTLAGIKMANLFNYRFVSEDEFDSEIKTANMNLNEKGVYIEVLRKTDMSSLIYVYRPSMLFKAVNNDDVWNILSSYGYIERRSTRTRLGTPADSKFRNHDRQSEYNDTALFSTRDRFISWISCRRCKGVHF